jgi:hypothetical protein
MSRRKALLVVGLVTVLGAAIGIGVADWRFKNPSVLLSSRILLGGIGAVVGGYGTKWLLLGKRQDVA